jgi:hypothetical protein
LVDNISNAAKLRKVECSNVRMREYFSALQLLKRQGSHHQIGGYYDGATI